MKNVNFLSKTFATIGLIAALATVISTTPQRDAIAQMDLEVPTDIDREACAAAGFYSFYLTQNIDLSYEQMEALYEIETAQKNAFEQLIDSYPKGIDYSSAQFVKRPGVYLPPDVSQAMDEATATMGLDLTAESAPEILAALNEAFGQYGEFGLGQTFTLTAAQKEEIEQLEAGFEAQSVDVFTGEQQQQYQENLETESRINEACGIVKFNFVDTFFTPFEPTTF
jgi:hypothetical protein